MRKLIGLGIAASFFATGYGLLSPSTPSKAEGLYAACTITQVERCSNLCGSTDFRCFNACVDYCTDKKAVDAS